MFGSHCLRTHSQTQETVALSSGESELHGIAKAAIGIGIKSLFGNFGLEMDVQVIADLSGARSVASRRGAGRVRLVEICELWAQDKSPKGALSMIRGEDDGAAGLTKQVDRTRLEKYVKESGCAFRDGRREPCPHTGDV